MLDDDNSKEIEAALREDEELDIPEGVTPEEWKRIQEEAQAEEEFIADREDTVKPLVFTKKDGTAIDDPETRPIDASDGVLGSGDLETGFGEPISNEEELRKESVEEDINPISNTGDAAEPVADAPVEDAGIGDIAAEPALADSPVDAAPTSEPVAEPAPAAENPADPSVVAAPSADVPAATETPTPIPGGMPMSPVSADAPVAAAGAEPKKKKKTGLIIGLVVFFLLLVGGGIAGFLFYNAHEAPEQQVKDAISNVLNAKTLGATKVAAIESGKLPHIKMSASSESSNGMNLSVEFALKGNSTFYVKAGGLSELSKKITEQLGTSSSSAEGGEIATKMIDSIIKPLDNTWIALAIEDAESKATVSCFQESMDGLSSESFRKKMSDNFDKNTFVKYKKDSKVENRDGINYYEVEIDEDAEKAFFEEFEKTDEYKAFETCMTKNGVGGSAIKKTTARLSATKEYDDAGEHAGLSFGVGDYAKDKDTVIKLGISSWSHELQAIEMVATDKDGKKDIANFSFETISEDDVKDAKTVEQLVKELENAVKETYASYIEVYAAQYCKEAKEMYGEEFEEYFGTEKECVNMLKEEMGKQLDGFDLSSLMGGLGGMVQTRI